VSEEKAVHCSDGCGVGVEKGHAVFSSPPGLAAGLSRKSPCTKGMCYDRYFSPVYVCPLLNMDCMLRVFGMVPG
jgi:hypothetical protein